MSEQAPQPHEHYFPVGSLKLPRDFRGLVQTAFGTTTKDSDRRGDVGLMVGLGGVLLGTLDNNLREAGGVAFGVGFVSFWIQTAIWGARAVKEIKAERKSERNYQRSVENTGAVLASELLPIAKDVFRNSRPIPGTNPPRRTQVLVDYKDTVLALSLPISKLELHIYSYQDPMRYLVGLDMHERVQGQDNPAVTKMFFKFSEPDLAGFKFLGVESSTKPNFDLLEAVTMAQKAAPFVY